MKECKELINDIKEKTKYEIYKVELEYKYKVIEIIKKYNFKFIEEFKEYLSLADSYTPYIENEPDGGQYIRLNITNCENFSFQDIVDILLTYEDVKFLDHNHTLYFGPEAICINVVDKYIERIYTLQNTSTDNITYHLSIYPSIQLDRLGLHDTYNIKTSIDITVEFERYKDHHKFKLSGFTINEDNTLG